MSKDAYAKLVQMLNEHIEPLKSNDEKYKSLLEKIADSRFVVIGEGSHGTKEFYQTRIEITRELIQKKGFMAVVIEADWPDAYGIHRYIKGKGQETNAYDSLKEISRFPLWMWRNKSIFPFIDWLKEFNASISNPDKQIGFYGMDLYSLNASISAVIDYLKVVDPQAAERAKERYSCFDSMGVEPQNYGYLTNIGIKKHCIKEVIDQLMELQHHAMEYCRKNGIDKEDAYFFATQNARVVKNAEKYYRSMFEGQVSSWNIRDRHMVETLDILADHLEERFNKPAKMVVWAHNSHLGDARATEMGERGEVNVGQLMREQHSSTTYSIGFSTFEGTVSAADNWDEPVKCKTVNPGLEGSFEHVFHDLQYPQFLLDLRKNDKLEHYLNIPRLQRAIGVIYRPESERMSHYFLTHLPYQFDAVIHIDSTSAVEPLDDQGSWSRNESK